MQRWQSHLLNAILYTTNAEEAFELVVRGGKELGFEYCAYGLRWPLPITRPKVILMTNYQSALLERCRIRNDFEEHIPRRSKVHSHVPFVWTDIQIEETPLLTAEAKAAGLHFGWAKSIFGISGIVGTLTLARSSGSISATELEEKEAHMVWLAHTAHMVLSQCLKSTCPNNHPRGALTAKEMEVLRWTGDGKTSGEISSLMNISVNTVNFHVKNIVVKLDSTNKTQAVAKAAIYGIFN